MYEVNGRYYCSQDMMFLHLQYFWKNGLIMFTLDCIGDAEDVIYGMYNIAK